MKTSLKLKTLILLGGFLGVISLIIAANFHLNRLQKDYALIINMAGRQRMLSQKMTKEILGIAREKERNISESNYRESLSKTKRLFTTTLTALTYGGNTQVSDDKEVTLPAASNPEAIKQLKETSELWKNFDSNIEIVTNPDITPDSEEFKKAIYFIESNNGAILSAMNTVTERYQQEADSAISLLEKLQIGMLGLSILVVAGTFWIIKLTLIRPAIKMAGALGAVSTGDLTKEVSVTSNDEIGEMASTVNSMTVSISTMIKGIRTSSSNISFVSGQISASAQELNAGAEIQNTAVSRTSSSIEEMNASLKEITENTSSLSSKAGEVASTTLEMAASTGEVAKIAEGLSYTVEEVTSSISEMASSVKEIAGHASHLSNFSSDTAAAVSQINASIKEVEGNLKISGSLSEATASDASAGMEAVNKTIDGMKKIKETVDNAAQVIKRLGAKSEAIGDILDVINEVAEQTSLLALNAAIIAAQAGEHGKGFSVVADEIKGLADRTTISTREIEILIKGVQSEVTNAVKSITAGGQSVDAGMKVSSLAGDALKKIISSANSSRQMVEQIARASQEQLKGSQQASEAMEKITDMIAMVYKAIEDQEKGSTYMAIAAEKMKDAASQVKRATGEQSQNGSIISKAIEDISEAIKSIYDATKTQTKQTQDIVLAISEIKYITDKTMSEVGTLKDSTVALSGQTGLLEDAVNKFKV